MKKHLQASCESMSTLTDPCEKALLRRTRLSRERWIERHSRLRNDSPSVWNKWMKRADIDTYRHKAREKHRLPMSQRIRLDRGDMSLQSKDRSGSPLGEKSCSPMSRNVLLVSSSRLDRRDLLTCIRIVICSNETDRVPCPIEIR